MAKTKTYGVNFGELLLLAFIVLKLTHIIDWSWWWVLSPIWVGLGLAIIIATVVVIVEAYRG